MQFVQKTFITRYFDTSVVIPCNDSIQALAYTLPLNQDFLQRNGIEVIVAVHDARLEKEVLELIESRPCINWKLIVNKDPNLPYDQRRAVNAAIEQAVNRYVFILYPGMEIVTDVIYQFRYLLHHYSVAFAYADRKCLMVERSAWLWEENANMITALELRGIKGMQVPQAIAVERFTEDAVVTVPVSGRAEYELALHWKFNKNAKFRKQLLDGFANYWLAGEDVFDKKYPLICLIQTRNEIQHIPAVLEHIDRHCDGIILLDDGSVDGSYEKAFSEKLLLKVSKNYSGSFDDLANRNLLLQLGHLFKCNWFFFLDADERFASNRMALEQIMNNDRYDTVMFSLVNLWDDEKVYRKDIPRSDHGVYFRYRMFRNKGYMQIIADRSLHFPATPYFLRANKLAKDPRIWVLHYGMLEAKARKRKYESYLMHDENSKMQGHPYDYLLDRNCDLGRVEELGILNSK